jgi:hypothetical protein
MSHGQRVPTGLDALGGSHPLDMVPLQSTAVARERERHVQRPRQVRLHITMKRPTRVSLPLHRGHGQRGDPLPRPRAGRRLRRTSVADGGGLDHEGEKRHTAGGVGRRLERLSANGPKPTVRVGRLWNRLTMSFIRKFTVRGTTRNAAQRG